MVKKTGFFFILLFFFLSALYPAKPSVSSAGSSKKTSISPEAPTNQYPFEIKVPYFLGNPKRCFYGKGPVPENLKVLWKKKLGRGKTLIWGKSVEMAGTGWTGQATLVEENKKLYVVFGSLNHTLYKLDADTGRTVWEHRFDDVIKASPYLYFNPRARNAKEKGIVFCGSRGRLKGTSGNYRAISLLTGKELWSFRVPRTESFSTDVDSDGLILDGIQYLPAENGYFYIMDPDPAKALGPKNSKRPFLMTQIKLYTKDDVTKFSNNLALESGVSFTNGMLYLSASHGAVFGIDRMKKEKTWEYLTGDDTNPSPVITHDNCLFVGTEMRYTTNGGVYKLNTQKKGDKALEWFFPVKRTNVAMWHGGVIGSVGINDLYKKGDDPYLCAFTSLDGNLYVLTQDKGRLVWKYNIGSSISTPVFMEDRIIAGSYDKRLYVFKIDALKQKDADNTNTILNEKGEPYIIEINKVESFYTGGEIESTPVVWSNRIYVGCKNGYFYCIGGR